jgi:hypothetical protein
MSTTVTLNRTPGLTLPAVSVAEQVTRVVPSANVDPEAGVQVADIKPSTRSSPHAL